ncbi:hypothetical protein HPT29_008090 [Microvirga terrae]|uniref:Uncharacterized protein n=1 Tax=Microvirga terrae TaxID=2740529 RepID=A0ABY5RUY6_9HYPH|nr:MULTISPECIES: hypothetical protein [Microvirga]MBQ0823884.1 hypothetical protein [Microvirga sp. HBU67558]UVF21070.1 hypothetical protein HPT29_008090 [Microvirga terrae]
MIADVQVKVRRFVRQAMSGFTRATGLPRITADESEAVPGPSPSATVAPQSEAPDRLSSALHAVGESLRLQVAADFQPLPLTRIEELGRPSDMNASVDTLAEQMLTLVEIVSAQERDIKALKEQCRRLEEHDQAIAVAFSTFFHVLSAGRVAKLSEIAHILNNIIKIAEQEGRPPASIKFLQDLAGMLSDEQR